MATNISVRFSERLRKLRKEYGYTQQELAELAEIEYKHIQRLESKKPCDVKLSTIEKLAKAFKITLAELLKL
ncbi:MAG: helix-turn-helix transcriptional regulator [Planctomycetota bacterium]